VSNLKKIIKQELGEILIREGMADRAQAVWNSLNDDGCEGPNRDICKAQTIVDGFLRKVRPLEAAVQKDIEKLNLSESTGLLEMFQRQGKVQNVLDHLQAVVEAKPSDLADGKVPGLLAPEWEEASRAKGSALEMESRTMAQKDEIGSIIIEMEAFQELQLKMKNLFEELYEINESITNESEALRTEPTTTQFSDGFLEEIREMFDNHKETVKEIENMENVYEEFIDKMKKRILTLKLTS